MALSQTSVPSGRTRVDGPRLRSVASLRRLVRYHAAPLAWHLTGRPAPPPPAIKHRVIRSYQREYGLGVLIETGTYMGDTVAALRKDFARIYSIELSRRLHTAAAARFAGDPSIHILAGDSSEVLPGILAGIDTPCLFWLDGHWSAGVTARGSRDTPIVAELDAVLRHRVTGHVILVDDARCFDGRGDYPALGTIRHQVASYDPTLVVEVKDDIIRISPGRPKRS